MSAITRRYPMLGSSADPTKVALTVKGILVVATPAVIVLAGWLKINLGTEDWQNVVEMLWQLSNQVILVVGMAMTAVGALRKLYYKIRYK